MVKTNTRDLGEKQVFIEALRKDKLLLGNKPLLLAFGECRTEGEVAKRSKAAGVMLRFQTKDVEFTALFMQEGKDTDSIMALKSMFGDIGRHRLKRALHQEGHLEAPLSGFAGWQPASSVQPEMLAKYFASREERNIRRRRGW